MHDAKTLERTVRKLLIYHVRDKHMGRHFTAQGLRRTWTDYKRNSVQPHIAFERFLNLYWEIRRGCH